MFIDTHAHLNYPELQKNLPDILKRAQDNGVEKIIVPATTYKTSIEVVELVNKHDMLCGAVGIHPTELDEFEEEQLAQIEKLANENKIVAIGEIGLDYYWKPYNKELEHYVLKAQLQIAKNTSKPVILHNRNSSKDLMMIVEEEFENGKLRAQFHSFSGDYDMAKRCVEMGFYISFTGNLTYKPNEYTYNAYQIVKDTPLKNLLLETDTPYLPPVPHRGKQNEPSFVIHTAQKIAELRAVPAEEISIETTANAKRLFNL
jgi:TatD DNase family protein